MDIVSQGKSVMLALGAAKIMYLMLGLSALSVGTILERAWFFFRHSDNLEKLGAKLDAHLEMSDVAGAIEQMKQSRSAEAAIVVCGLEKSPRGAEAAAEAMIGATAVQRMKLERGLAFLGTLGNNAPFIGLFGTVIGIISAFEKLGAAGAMSSSASSEVMASIAEALVATAIGLAVAIPSVAFYNYFQRRIKATVSNTEALTRILLSWMKSERPTLSGRASQSPRLALVARKEA